MTMTADDLRAIVGTHASRLPPDCYDEYGYPTRRHWDCPVCRQSITWLSPPQAMVRAVDRHEQSAKHRAAVCNTVQRGET